MVSHVEQRGVHGGPPAVIFQPTGRLWLLGLQNAWQDLRDRGVVHQPLPRMIVAHEWDMLARHLQSRPTSFLVLRLGRESLSEWASHVATIGEEFPLVTIAVADQNAGHLGPFLSEIGVRCAVTSPCESDILARWLAWHLRRLPQTLRDAPAQIWDRLPWKQWADDATLKSQARNGI